MDAHVIIQLLPFFLIGVRPTEFALYITLLCPYISALGRVQQHWSHILATKAKVGICTKATIKLTCIFYHEECIP